MANPIKTPKGYRCHFCYQGKQYRCLITKNRFEAQTIQGRINFIVASLNKELMKVPQGIDLGKFVFSMAMEDDVPQAVPQPPTVYLTELAEKFLNYSSSRYAEKTHESIKIHVRHLLDFVEHTEKCDPRLDQINAGLFYDYMDERFKQGISKNTINRELTSFQAMFDLACECNMLKENVVRRVKRYCYSKPKFRTIPEAERTLERESPDGKELKAILRFRILDAEAVREFVALTKDTWVYPVLVTLAYTGIRKDELIRMKWSHVDLEHGFIDIYSCKGPKNEEETLRIIPIHEELLPMLIEQYSKTGHQEWVFVGPKTGMKLNRGSLGNKIRKMLKGTKFEGLACHAFRYGFGTILAGMEVDRRHIGIFMGHRTEAMMKKYQRMFAEKTRELINKLDYDI